MRQLFNAYACLAILIATGVFAQTTPQPAASSAQTPLSTPTPTAAAPVEPETLLVVGEQPGPGMWKVSKGDHVLWIIGTQSPMPQKMKWRAKGIKEIIAQSQEILSEPSVSIGIKQIGFFSMLTMIPSAMEARKNPNGATLKEVVPAELYPRWLALRDKYIDFSSTAAEDDDIERSRPMAAALELYSKAIQKSGLTRTSPVWPVIKEAAKKSNVKITDMSFEPPISNVRAALNELKATQLADIDCFAKTIERIESDLGAMRLRANAWATGDIDAIRKLPIGDQRTACETAIRDATFVKTLGMQNIQAQIESKWMSTVEIALAKNTVTLTTLPIERLLASDGYLAKLRAKGYTVEEPQ